MIWRNAMRKTDKWASPKTQQGKMNCLCLWLATCAVIILVYSNVAFARGQALQYSHRQQQNRGHLIRRGPRYPRYNRPPYLSSRRGLAGLTTSSIFSPFPLCEKSWFAWWANWLPLFGETLISSVPTQKLPRLSLGPLKGLAAWAQCPSGPSIRPHVLLLELQRYKDTVRCVALGAEVPGHHQIRPTQTLFVRLLETHFFTPIHDPCEKSIV